ncbi:hypothetical protein CCHOA_00065 [Corynebacterium choanae]|uniref:Uncharacterized protein n=2 Tax=Corynebacterium choanae TaxID=1862358 RepID=A0A3G6J3E8_9CORY|nr:hypothetical protein CCHOA_00065 [Corynebacterium choanae]
MDLQRTFASLLKQTIPPHGVIVFAAERLDGDCERIIHDTGGVAYYYPGMGGALPSDLGILVAQAIRQTTAEVVLIIAAGAVANQERIAQQLSHWEYREALGKPVGLIGSAYYEFPAAVEFSDPLDLVAHNLGVRSSAASVSAAQLAAVSAEQLTKLTHPGTWLITPAGIKTLVALPPSDFAGESFLHLWHKVATQLATATAMHHVAQPLTWIPVVTRQTKKLRHKRSKAQAKSNRSTIMVGQKIARRRALASETATQQETIQSPARASGQEPSLPPHPTGSRPNPSEHARQSSWLKRLLGR